LRAILDRSERMSMAAGNETLTNYSADRSPKRASYRSGFAFGALSFLSVATLGLVSTIVTSRLYGVHIIGQFALVSAPVGALWVLSSIKEQQALIKEITGLPPQHPRVTELFAVVFTFSASLTVVVASLDAWVCWVVFRGPLHQPGLVDPAFVSIAGYALITNTGWNIDSVLSAFVAGRAIFWVRLHEAFSFIVIAIVAGLLWHSVWSLVVATIGASCTSLVHRSIAVQSYLRLHLTRSSYRSGLRVLPDLLRFGLRATPGQIAQGASQQGGVWAVGLVAPVAVVGAFSRALTIPQRLQQVSNRITEVLYPTLVHRHTTGDGEGFDRALVDSIRYEVVGMLLLAAAIGGSAHSVLAIFGPGFSRATPALVLLLLYPALASITVTQTQALWATNRPGRTSLIAIARLCVTLAMLLILTPKLHVVGPAVALLVGYLFVALLSGIALRPVMNRPARATWSWHERAALALAYACGFVAAHLIEQATPQAPGIIASIAAGSAAYLAAFVAFGGVNDRDRRRLRELRDRNRSRRAKSAITPPLGAEKG
jgi:O-antigen/teichoic acid export membrane protein